MQQILREKSFSHLVPSLVVFFLVLVLLGVVRDGAPAAGHADHDDVLDERDRQGQCHHP